ncbi:hypothetical protein N9934_01755 [Desulfosarcina sp.]|nr:hypothetical protein [Desulfosarcina sp.]
MDKLVIDAAMRNNVSYYEEKLNKLGITIEEMSKTLESDEERRKERTTVSVSTFLLVVIVIGMIFTVFVSVT